MIDKIRAALDAQIAAIVPSWPIAWENTKYQPQSGVSHHRTYLLPAAPLTIGVFRGSVVQHGGLYQVDVITSTEGGASEGDARASLIQTSFKRGTSLAVSGAANMLWVPDHPTISPAIFDATWRVVPVTIPWNILEGV